MYIYLHKIYNLFGSPIFVLLLYVCCKSFLITLLCIQLKTSKEARKWVQAKSLIVLYQHIAGYTCVTRLEIIS